MSQSDSDLSNDELLMTTNDENKESTTLLWFDPNIGTREDTKRTQIELRHINNYVIFHTDLDQCVTFIQSIDKEKIFLITSGTKASQILPLVASLRQIDSIFIFCYKKERYEHLINEYSKIIGIYVELKALCISIREQVDLFDKQLQVFSFFDQNQKATKDLSKESTEFLWFQLFNHVITRLPRNIQAKQQMIEMCRKYYRGNSKELKRIDEFERDYRPEHAISWYSKQSFIYKLINKALRNEDIDLLYTFRFFIGDLSESLDREHMKMLSSNEEILVVYRGAKLDKEEFDQLKENQGKLISTNGYLSTSRSRSLALKFAKKRTKRTDSIPVLFQIECDIKQLTKSIIFADIAELSVYKNEEEVLFDINACFQIASIEFDQSVHLIKMILSNEGQQITKDYLELIEKESEEKSVSIVFGRLMCDLGQYEKSQKYFEQLLNDPNGDDLAWIEFNIGRALSSKNEWIKAQEYYDRAYHRMLNAKPARIKDSAHVLNNIGVILRKQGKYGEALEYHQRALKMKEECYPSGHIDIATSLNNIGNILYEQRKYDEALGYYQRSLEMKEKYYPTGHIDIATSLNNVGNILNKQGKYDGALDYYQRALQIREKYYPSGHVAIARSLYNIGVILCQERKYDEALGYHQRALIMREKYYPSGHVDVGDSLNSIGLCYENQNERKMALDHFQRALTIYETFLPAEHSNRLKTEHNIRRLTKEK